MPKEKSISLTHPPLQPEVQATLSHLEALSYFQRRREINRIFKPKPPRFLFRFVSFDPEEKTSIDRIRNVLVHSKLWLSSPKDFNDPFDMSIKIEVAASPKERKQRLINACKNQGMNWTESEKIAKKIMKEGPKALEQKLQDAGKQHIGQIGICSFAGDPRNILMWSHYAKHHTGLCFIFEVARDYTLFTQALKVDYSTEYPTANWGNNFEQDLQKTILIKHEGWSYEKERRILKINQARSCLSFKPEALVGVISGCRANANSLSKLKELAKDRNESL